MVTNFTSSFGLEKVRIFVRTEEESQRRDDSGQVKQAKPHVINKAYDLLSLGWTGEEIYDIIHNIKA